MIRAGLPESCLLQAEAHSEIDELLACDQDVDLLIPRGSNKFVRYIMENTKIPVMGHSSGICHVYADKACDQEKALPIIVDAKTQYAAACNAMETLLIDRAIANAFLPKAAAALAAAGVTLRGTEEAAQIVSMDVMAEDEFATEYGDLICSVKLVNGVEEAIRHINTYGSHHTDASSPKMPPPPHVSCRWSTAPASTTIAPHVSPTVSATASVPKWAFPPARSMPAVPLA